MWSVYTLFQYPTKVETKLDFSKGLTLYSDHLKEQKSSDYFRKSSWAAGCSVGLHRPRASGTWEALYFFSLLSVPFLPGNETVLAHGWWGKTKERKKTMCLWITSRKQCSVVDGSFKNKLVIKRRPWLLFWRYIACKNNVLVLTKLHAILGTKTLLADVER